MEFEKIQKIIVEVLNVDSSEITPQTTFVDDLGADSLDLFQIIMCIEEEFDLQIDASRVENIRTVQDAIDQLKQSARADCNESPQSRTDLRSAPVGAEQTSTGRLAPPDRRSGAGLKAAGGSNA